MTDRRSTIVLAAGLALCLVPGASPAIALTVGMALALSGLVVAPTWAKPTSRWLIQGCIVLLGLRMNLSELAKAGTSGVLFAVGTIVGVFVAAVVLGKLLKIDRVVTTLLATGTAICGGSAIAAVGPAIAAGAAEMSIATGVVFLLNAIALYVFPPLGQALHLSAVQYGTWSAVAIHDVASVVGAAKAFGDPTGVAETTATAVKLARTIWIAPIALGAGWWFRRHGSAGADAKAPIPWFILWFVAASTLRTFVPDVAPYADLQGKFVAAAGMAAALLLIGAGLNKKALASVGWRALVLGVALWVLVSVSAAIVVVRTLP